MPHTQKKGATHIATAALALSVLACISVGILLVQGHSPMNQPSPQAGGKWGPELPLLQAYVAWHPKVRAIIQKQAMSPKDALMQNTATLKKFTDDLFAKFDKDGSGDLNQAEQDAAWAALVADEMIPAPPTEQQLSLIKKKTGDTINKEEFVAVTMAAITVLKQMEQPNPSGKMVESPAKLIQDPAKLKEFTDDLFDRFDEDGSGDLNQVEQDAAWAALVADKMIPGPPTEEQLSAINKKLGDTINKDEFVLLTKATITVMQQVQNTNDYRFYVMNLPSLDEMMKDQSKLRDFSDELFDGLDVNHDGVLDSMEMTATWYYLIGQGYLSQMPSDDTTKTITDKFGKNVDKDEFAQASKGVLQTLVLSKSAALSA